MRRRATTLQLCFVRVGFSLVKAEGRGAEAGLGAGTAGTRRSRPSARKAGTVRSADRV